MNYSTTYYWRIDEDDGVTTHKGPLWSFTIQPDFGSGLVGWWKLDETSGTTASDSALTNHGTLLGNPVWTSGWIDGALQFDGAGDYISVPDNPSLRFNQYNSFTITCWAKPAPRYGWMVCKMRASGTGIFGYTLAYEYTYTRFTFGVESSDIWTSFVNTTSNSAPAGSWYHVAGVYSNKSMKIYLNGQLKNSGTFGGDAGTTTPDKALAIGAWSYDTTVQAYFDGILDDVRIYNKALSPAEITEIYKEGFGGKACNPNPIDGAAVIDTNATLGWLPGLNAVSHDVYFGTSFNDVNSSTTPITTTDVNSYDPGALSCATTYYWRIDEFDGTVTVKGDIWSFTTVSGKATNPSPANGTGGVDPNNMTLTWSAGPYATSHDVYFGTSFADVNSSTTPVATTSATSYDLGTLNHATTYYWRIDEFDGDAIVEGDIWSFTTQPDPGLNIIGWWKLDETSGTTAYDSAGSNHGTLYGNPLWTTGQIDGALAFDGLDDYVNCGNDTSLDITDSISISAWVKFNHLPNYQTIVAKRGGASDSVANYAFRTSAGGTSNELEFYFRAGSTWHIYATYNTSLHTGTWYHVAVTFTYGTGSSIKCYCNGVLRGGSWTSGNGNAAVTANTKPLTIGALTDAERTNGIIDDVRIYNRALSDSEILQIYQAGLP